MNISGNMLAGIFIREFRGDSTQTIHDNDTYTISYMHIKYHTCIGPRGRSALLLPHSKVSSVRTALLFFFCENALNQEVAAMVDHSLAEIIRLLVILHGNEILLSWLQHSSEYTECAGNFSPYICLAGNHHRTALEFLQFFAENWPIFQSLEFAIGVWPVNW